MEASTTKSKSELSKALHKVRKELDRAKERLKEISTIFKNLYEDNADGKISDERFAKMISSCETEQKVADVKQLSAGLIREFVDKIYVSEKQVVDGKKVQKIRILWNCIGEFTPSTGFSNLK